MKKKFLKTVGKITAFWVAAQIHINKIQCRDNVILVDLEGTG